jgi:hypothetical protein
MNADFHVAIGRVCFRLDRTDGASVAGEGAYPTRARAPTPYGEVSGHEASQL